MSGRRICAADLPDGCLSVVVFGPGHGEAVLLRFPDGTLGVLDGCLEGPENPVLRLALELGGRVRFAALTHPHEDHALGLEEVIRELRPQEVWYAGADHPRLFAPLVEMLRRLYPRSGAEVDLKRPADKVIERAVNGLEDAIQAGSRPLELMERQEVFRAAMGAADLVVRCVLPTTPSRMKARSWLGRDCPPDDERWDELDDVETHDRHINEISAALLVEWGGARVLLMGDAEAGDPMRGVASLNAIGPVQVLKAAHHASRGAYVERMLAAWEPLVIVVTPFSYGSGRQPPQQEGLRLLAGRRTLLTAPPTWHKPRSTPAVAVPGAKLTTPRPPRNADSAVLVCLDKTGGVVREERFGDALVWHEGPRSAPSA